MNDKQAKKEILRFLKAYIKWVESGAMEHLQFSTEVGLCTNFFNYCGENRYWDMEDTYKGLFNFRSYPFNNGEYLDYDKECMAGTTHLNHKRLAWVYTTIAQLKEELKNV